MTDALFSIKSMYAQAIYEGVKTVELRRVVPRVKVDRIYLYEVSPIKAITGYFTPGERIRIPMKWPGLLAEYRVPELLGGGWMGPNYVEEVMTRIFGDKYWTPIEVEDPIKLNKPVLLTELNPPITAPQSWRYLTAGHSKFLAHRAKEVSK